MTLQLFFPDKMKLFMLVPTNQYLAVTLTLLHILQCRKYRMWLHMELHL